ncbi:MAG: hypothetical protein RBU37_27265, partial [Myxococcota bacterium]|nr:hypothetical protein [Myxococcota bacterium]
MRRLPWALTMSMVLLLPAASWAADITDVIDAFDADIIDGKLIEDPFDFRLTPSFHTVYEQAKITREANCTQSGRCPAGDEIIFNKEMRYKYVRNQMDIRADIPVYKDLAFHIVLPVVFHESRSWKFAKNGGAACEFETNPDDPKCVDGRNSTLDPDVPTDVAPYNYFNIEDDYSDGPSRSGLSDLRFGITWAPFNDQRYVIDEKPWGRNHGRASLLLGFEYTAPTAAIATNQPGNTDVGRGLHELALRIAASRRYKYVDPYMQLQVGLPLPASDTLFKDYGSGQARVAPGPWGEFTVGLEIIPWESITPDFQQFFKIDFQGFFKYTGEGRDYGPLFDAIGSSECQGITLAEIESGTSERGLRCAWMAEKWANAGFENLGAIDPYGNRNNALELYDDGITDYEGFG